MIRFTNSSGVRIRRRGAHRRGNTLIMGILLIIAIMGLAALTIDLGIARVAQRQMQSAADVAAVEALRYRDDPAAAQSNAQAIINLTFQDFEDPDTGMKVEYGAGPAYQFSGGIPLTETDYVASQTLSVPEDDSFYTPQLDAADQNDMAGGTYGFNNEYPSEIPSDELYDGTHYQRRDFTPFTSNDTTNASLVRLRRTAENPDLNGGPIPYLFAPGNLVSLARENPQAQSLAARGISVRATAIAAAGLVNVGNRNYPVGTVVAAGSAPADIDQLAPFALNRGYWANPIWTSAQGSPVEVDPDEVIWIDRTFYVIGQPVVSSAAPAQIAPSWVCAPILDANLGNRIVGFGYALGAIDADGQLTVVRPWNENLNENAGGLARFVARGNATAAVPAFIPVPDPFPDAETAQEVFTAHDSFARDVDNMAPLMAPVLVNRHLGSSM